MAMTPTRKTKTVYVTVALEIDEGANVNTVIDDMDYDFIHDNIVTTEIRHVDTTFVAGIGFLTHG
jgi:hypothetical protein